MPVLAGQGDPARSMALLWRTPSARTGPGPKPGLSVDAIVAAGGASEQAWSGRTAALRQVAPDFAQRFPDSAWLASAGAAHRRDDATPYLEREAMEAFTVGLTVLLDGIQAAMAKDPTAR